MGIYIYIYIYDIESDQAGIQDKKNCGGLKMYDRTPPNFFRLQIQKADVFYFSKSTGCSCAIIGFHFIDERVPKKCYFLAILVDKFYESFFQSHLIYISIIGMMQNCIHMFKASL